MKKVTTLLSCILIYTVGFAQQTSAYIQSQFQYGEESASLKVGGPNENKEDPYSRFGIRRGRIKFTYKEGIASAVFQIDITEKGFDYKMYVQEIGKLPVSAVVKYDCYNPNIKVSKNDIGLNGTGEGDIKYSTIGAGLLFKVNKCIRLQAYYQWISNEKSKYLVHFNEDIKDNLFTLRLQYKFK